MAEESFRKKKMNLKFYIDFWSGLVYTRDEKKRFSFMSSQPKAVPVQDFVLIQTATVEIENADL